jgi:hypothetical protein
MIRNIGPQFKSLRLGERIDGDFHHKWSAFEQRNRPEYHRLLSQHLI